MSRSSTARLLAKLKAEQNGVPLIPQQPEPTKKKNRKRRRKDSAAGEKKPKVDTEGELSQPEEVVSGQVHSEKEQTPRGHYWDTSSYSQANFLKNVKWYCFLCYYLQAGPLMVSISSPMLKTIC